MMRTHSNSYQTAISMVFSPMQRMKWYFYFSLFVVFLLCLSTSAVRRPSATSKMHVYFALSTLDQEQKEKKKRFENGTISWVSLFVDHHNFLLLWWIAPVTTVGEWLRAPRQIASMTAVLLCICNRDYRRRLLTTAVVVDVIAAAA